MPAMYDASVTTITRALTNLIHVLGSVCVGNVTLRLPSSNCSGLRVLRYAMVLRSRSTSSGNVVSVSSYFGGSTWARRDVPIFATSDAICTCLESGNMSG